jgi:hypothetical protein
LVEIIAGARLAARDVIQERVEGTRELLEASGPDGPRVVGLDRRSSGDAFADSILTSGLRTLATSRTVVT